jgi:hypothetical protein
MEERMDDPNWFPKAVRDGKVNGFSIDPANPIFDWEWMPLDAEPGTMVIYTGQNGTEADKRWANQRLVKGGCYTLKAIEVGGWSSEVELEEVNGSFNSVHFALRKAHP